MDEQGNDHDNQVKIAIYKAAPLHWSGLLILLEDDNPMINVPAQWHNCTEGDI